MGESYPEYPNHGRRQIERLWSPVEIALVVSNSTNEFPPKTWLTVRFVGYQTSQRLNDFERMVAKIEWMGPLEYPKGEPE